MKLNYLPVAMVMIRQSLASSSLIRLVLLMLTSLSITGCTYQYTTQKLQDWRNQLPVFQSHQLQRNQNWVLSSSSALYVAYPSADFPRGLRSQLVQQLTTSLQRRSATVFRGKEPVTIQQALKLAKDNNCEFLIYPKIIHAIDRVSSFEEVDEDMESYDEVGLDRLLIQLSVYDINSGKLVEVASLEGHSAWLAYSKGTPADLMSGGFDQFSQEFLTPSSL